MGLDHHTYVGPYLHVQKTEHDYDLLELIEEREDVFDIRGEYGDKDICYVFGANKDIGRSALFSKHDSVFEIPLSQELITSELNMLLVASSDVVAFCTKHGIKYSFGYGIVTGAF